MGRELHVISNGRTAFQDMIAVAKEVDFLHIREGEKSARELCEGIDLLLAGGVPPEKLVVNDRLDVACVRNVYGVQLGYRSVRVAEAKQAWPKLLAGCSVHSAKEAGLAEKEGADWLVYGHVFLTESKAGVPARGLAELARIVRQVRVPVIAIGGITPERVDEVLQAGASGIAVMSGIWDAADPAAAARMYYNKVKGMEKHEQNV